jgi:DNA-3-methyladenine glycosylase I
MDRKRCWGSSQLMIDYHDKEWGVPLHSDKKIFEFLVLESMQAGLSWDIVLRKRENFRKALHGFDARKIAKYGDADLKRLLNDSGIIRNRAKINAVINNARRFLEVQKEFGTFDKYIWQFVGGKPKDSRLKTLKEMPATSLASDKMSEDLRKRGFKFVGSTICYAHMQATGMVNDHLTGCFRHREVR